MKFTVATLLAFAAVAFAYPMAQDNVPIKRQNSVNTVDASVPSMSDASGNIIPFDATRVNAGAAARRI